MDDKDDISALDVRVNENENDITVLDMMASVNMMSITMNSAAIQTNMMSITRRVSENAGAISQSMARLSSQANTQVRRMDTNLRG